MSCFSTIGKKGEPTHLSNLLKIVTDKIVKNYFVNGYIVYILSLKKSYSEVFKYLTLKYTSVSYMYLIVSNG